MLRVVTCFGMVLRRLGFFNLNTDMSLPLCPGVGEAYDPQV
jgi:hypothetical protein